MARKKRKLNIGDRVTVTSRGYEGREGTVLAMQGQSLSVRLDPTRDRTAVTLSFLPSSLQRITVSPDATVGMTMAGNAR